MTVLCAELASSVHLIFQPLAVIGVAIRPCHDTLSRLDVLGPLSCVLATGRVRARSLPYSLVVFPTSFIAFPSLIRVCATTIPLVLIPITLIHTRTIWPGLLPFAIALSLEPLSIIDSTVTVSEDPLTMIFSEAPLPFVGASAPVVYSMNTAELIGPLANFR